jgi:hypothetical protein
MARTYIPGREAQPSGSLVAAIDRLAKAVTLLTERLGPSQPTPPPLGGRGRHLRVVPHASPGDTPWDRLSVVELRALLRDYPIDRSSLPAPIENLRRTELIEALRQIGALGADDMEGA